MSLLENNRNPHRRIYNTQTQEVVRHTELADQVALDEYIRGVIIDRPFVDVLGKGKRMLGFIVRGSGRILGSTETDYQVRIFGRRAGRLTVDQGSRVRFYGCQKTFLEKDAEGNFVRGEYFIVATNWHSFKPQKS